MLPMRHTATPQRSKNVQAHTHSFAHRDSVCCMSRSSHALLPLTLRELSQLTAVTQKDVRVRPSSTCHLKPKAQSYAKASRRKRQYVMLSHPAISHAEVNRQKEKPEAR